MSGINFDSMVLGPCMATFGEANQGYPTAVYTPANGAPFPLPGIFDPMTEEVRLKEGIPVTVHFPVFSFRASDFQNPPANWNLLQDDQITVRGKTYQVRECKDDGHGGIALFLNNLSLT